MHCVLIDEWLVTMMQQIANKCRKKGDSLIILGIYVLDSRRFFSRKWLQTYRYLFELIRCDCLKFADFFQECSVCMEPFSSTKVPKLLVQCGHTVCLDCLIQMENNNNERLDCPECRTPNKTDAGVRGGFE